MGDGRVRSSDMGKGINLIGVPVTLTSGDSSWGPTKHSGFIRAAKDLDGEYYELTFDYLAEGVPEWLRRQAASVTLCIHFPEESKKWAHSFAINSRREQDEYLFLRARTPSGDPPVWD